MTADVSPKQRDSLLIYELSASSSRILIGEKKNHQTPLFFCEMVIGFTLIVTIHTQLLHHLERVGLAIDCDCLLSDVCHKTEANIDVSLRSVWSSVRFRSTADCIWARDSGWEWLIALWCNRFSNGIATSTGELSMWKRACAYHLNRYFLLADSEAWYMIISLMESNKIRGSIHRHELHSMIA